MFATGTYPVWHFLEAGTLCYVIKHHNSVCRMTDDAGRAIIQAACPNIPALHQHRAAVNENLSARSTTCRLVSAARHLGSWTIALLALQPTMVYLFPRWFWIPRSISALVPPGPPERAELQRASKLHIFGLRCCGGAVAADSYKQVADAGRSSGASRWIHIPLPPMAPAIPVQGAAQPAPSVPRWGERVALWLGHTQQPHKYGTVSQYSVSGVGGVRWILILTHG